MLQIKKVLALLALALTTAAAVPAAAFEFPVKPEIVTLTGSKTSANWSKAVVQSGDVVWNHCGRVLYNEDGLLVPKALVVCEVEVAVANNRSTDSLDHISPGDVLMLPLTKWQLAIYAGQNVIAPDFSVINERFATLRREIGDDLFILRAQARGELSELKLRVAELTSEVATNTDHIAANTNWLSAAEGRLDDQGNQLSALTDKVNKLSVGESVTKSVSAFTLPATYDAAGLKSWVSVYWPWIVVILSFILVMLAIWGLSRRSHRQSAVQFSYSERLATAESRLDDQSSLIDDLYERVGEVEIRLIAGQFKASTSCTEAKLNRLAVGEYIRLSVSTSGHGAAVPLVNVRRDVAGNGKAVLVLDGVKEGSNLIHPKLRKGQETFTWGQVFKLVSQAENSGEIIGLTAAAKKQSARKEEKATPARKSRSVKPSPPDEPAANVTA